MHYLLFALSGLAVATASLLPETWWSLACAVLCASCMSAALVPARGRYRGSLLAGLSFHLVAFYWVPATVQTFGGFSFVGALAVFLLFVVTASIQFLLVGVLYSFAIRSPAMRTLGLSLPFAWMCGEYFFPRLFPWQIAHSLVIWSPIAGSAEFVGVTPLSGLLMWWGVLLHHAVSHRAVSAARLGALSAPRFAGVCMLLISAVAFTSGLRRNAAVAEQLERSPRVSVALVQGNLSTEQKGNAAFMLANLGRYQELSNAAVAQGADIVFWPESVVNQWLPEGQVRLRNTPYDPAPELSAPLLYGTLGYAPRSASELARLEAHYAAQPQLLGELQHEKYNAAVGVNQDGEVVGRYYKRILMPFGEFLPFADTFPVLRRISPQTGDFSVGRLVDPIVFPRSDRLSEELRVGTLICYEDLIPSISGAMVEGGANVLVNLTNDAWYGDTAAPHQHHLLAQWRAIETRKYMLRVTNTGKTAVVDPFGRTQASLPVFKEAVLVEPIRLLEGATVYSRHQDLVVIVLIGLGAVVVAGSSVRSLKGRAAKKQG